MTVRVAAMPMYDADRDAVEAWWQGIARALRTAGLRDLPQRLAWPADLDAHWRDPALLLSQTCGLPLVTTLAGKVQVVGAFRYTAPGCAGIGYRSDLVARDDDADTIEGFRGRTAAVNGFDSHSGANALRGHVAPLAHGGAFFGRWLATGSHPGSLAALRAGTADLAAIDCITLAGLHRRLPQALRGLRRIGATAVAPGLPLVTAAATPARELAALRRALAAACTDPALAATRAALFIGGFEVAAAPAWQPVDAVRRAAAAALGEPPQPAARTPGNGRG